MCISTVYVRNHYVADVLGGLLTGTLGYFLGRRVIEASGRAKNETKTSPRKRGNFNP
jgi:membrane-associated phospholipid phosphatase